MKISTAAVHYVNIQETDQHPTSRKKAGGSTCSLSHEKGKEAERLEKQQTEKNT